MGMGRPRRIIPCLDVAGGRVVKGVRFEQLRDAGDPVEVARLYDAQGADELVILDISATAEGRGNTLAMLGTIAAGIRLPVTVGGGVRSEDDARALLEAGAARVAIGTAAVDDPDLVARAARRFGSERVVVAIDARRREGSGWEVHTHGGRRPTGLDAVDWAARLASLGAGELLVTSMDRDGTRDGYDLELTAAIAAAVDVPVIASGGVGELQHLADGLTKGGADAVLAASIFHYGEHTIDEARRYLAERGIPLRRGPGSGATA